ncbi:unnamed protein product, partial [Iphiclides podalirius]
MIVITDPGAHKRATDEDLTVRIQNFIARDTRYRRTMGTRNAVPPGLGNGSRRRHASATVSGGRKAIVSRSRPGSLRAPRAQRIRETSGD